MSEKNYELKLPCVGCGLVDRHLDTPHWRCPKLTNTSEKLKSHVLVEQARIPTNKTQMYMQAKTFLEGKQEEHSKKYGVHVYTNSEIAEWMEEYVQIKTKNMGKESFLGFGLYFPDMGDCTK